MRREALSQRVNAAGADEVILALEQASVLREVEVDEEDYPSRGRPARRSLGLRPSAESLAQIAEKKTSADSKEEEEEGEVTPQADAPPRVPAPVPMDWPK